VTILRLPPGDVQVWHFALDVDADTQTALECMLDEEERRRASGMRFEMHRRRFAVRRGILRVILSRYLQTTPDSIRFTRNAHGKPGVALPADTLKFSASSSHELGAVAVARARDVGLDIERLRTERDHELIARQFAEEEASHLRQLAPHEREAAFFDLWTCKEAYLKGKGLGLSVPLDRFAVAASGDGPRLTRSELDEADAVQWSLYRLAVRPGFAACLAVAGGCDTVRCESYRF
jgi:4'-phosphopantetheinyl transferase